jgi:putative ABC transport system ATP-binding protein
MITHNMQHALTYGDRTMLMDNGRIILDLSATDKEGKSVQDLINLFSQTRNQQFLDDNILLAT